MIRNATLRAALAGALLASLSPPGAVAATRAGVTLPDTLRIDGRTLVLNGMGVRSFTFLQIRGYVGGLYLPSRSSDVAAILAEPNPKVLTIHYVHTGTAAQMHKSYMDASQVYCAHHTCTEADRTAFMTLIGVVRPVRPGEYSTFVITDAGVRVMLDGNQLAMIPDAHFGKVILESDLGQSAPSAELRDGLLGLSEE